MATLERGAGYSRLLNDFIESQFEHEQLPDDIDLDWAARVKDRVCVPVAAICRADPAGAYQVWIVMQDPESAGERTQRVFRRCTSWREAKTLQRYAERFYGIPERGNLSIKRFNSN